MRRMGKRTTTAEAVQNKQAELKRLRRKLAKAKRFGSQTEVDEIRRAMDSLRDTHDFSK